MNQQQVTERVARGLAWIMENTQRLDLDPMRVDLDTVNVRDSDTCILAQSGGRDFQDILTDAGNPDEDSNWIMDHGFAAPWSREYADQLADEAALTEEWRRVIRERPRRRRR